MQRKQRPTGFELRDAFEEELKGLETRCGACGRAGVIGKDLSVVYSESNSPWGRNYSVWAICEKCKEVYPQKPKK